MKYFLETVETIEPGVGFSHYDGIHLTWLGICAALILINCLWYRKLGTAGRARWKKTVAILLLADELFKMVMLFIGGRYLPDYLPLHLCSVNIFIIAVSAWRPSRILSNFLYTVCIPGALAALLFPTWTVLPLLNFMHLHSFTVHIMLAMYPMVLAFNGELDPQARDLPKCMLLLVALAVVAQLFNLMFDTNFMFLMHAEPGNPLYWFQQIWGNHLLGFPLLIAAVLVVMYVPMELWRKFRKKK